MSTHPPLHGCRAVVSGGTKGIGAAVVATLREAGATVITGARSVPASLPDGMHFTLADLSTTAGCSAFAEAAFATLGGIDILVHVVGGSSAPGGGFAALDDGEWTRALDLIAFLVSDKAAAITGTEYLIDGGTVPVA